MARIRTLVTEAGVTEAGFTLLELLVVMALAGLILALMPAAMGRTGAAARLTTAGDVVGQALALARSEAILSRGDAAFVLDVRTRGYAVTLQGGAVRLDGQLDSGLEIAMTVGEEAAIGGRGVLAFHPDGGSGGGRIRLSNAAGAVTLTVDWLTGRVQLANAR